MNARYLSVLSPHRLADWAARAFTRSVCALKWTRETDAQTGEGGEVLCQKDRDVVEEGLEERLQRVKKELASAKRRFRKERRKADILFALIIAQLLAAGINLWVPSGSPANGDNRVVCWVDHSGKLSCPVALEELKGKHVELRVPKNLDAASLLAAENEILSCDVETLMKTARQK